MAERCSKVALLSFLDLVPVLEGASPADGLRDAMEVARHCDALGLHRYWVAEHHGMASVGASSPAVVLARVGAETRRIRLGSGGVMLPNHAPLVVAEQFGTLDAWFPGRIDLGLGRAPGGDMNVIRALRRPMAGGDDDFPRDVQELLACIRGDQRLGYVATPGLGAQVEPWILGSSTYGARLAARLGLAYAYAAHISPGMAEQALATYHAHFRPSKWLERPRTMLSYNVFAADTLAEARFHASSMMGGFVSMRSGVRRSTRFPPPVEGYYESLADADRQMVDFMLTYGTVGTEDDLACDFAQVIARTQIDEIIVSCPIYDLAARKRSIAIAAEAMATACALPATKTAAPA